MQHALLHRAIALVYPPECAMCRAPTGMEFALCPDCLVETPFITGPVCQVCGIPVLGTTESESSIVCDDCLSQPRPWGTARAVLRYDKTARKIVLALKHGDRLDLVRTVTPWMKKLAAPMLKKNSLIVPVPLHPLRQFQRRYNQSAELARALSLAIAWPYAAQALHRVRVTPSLDHRSREERFDLLRNAITADPDMVGDRHILLVDDVMTSGATLATSAEAALKSGATGVDCLVLARVEKDDLGFQAR